LKAKEKDYTRLEKNLKTTYYRLEKKTYKTLVHDLKKGLAKDLSKNRTRTCKRLVED